MEGWLGVVLDVDGKLELGCVCLDGIVVDRDRFIVVFVECFPMRVKIVRERDEIDGDRVLDDRLRLGVVLEDLE
jgi:hypothetical protein